jgi:O-antigen/teichoic acid export membrane protein
MGGVIGIIFAVLAIYLLIKVVGLIFKIIAVLILIGLAVAAYLWIMKRIDRR